MATRDETLRFLLEVSGEKDLESLQKAMLQLGDEAKGSEGKASELVEQLDRLTTAARGSAEFVRLKASLAETSTQLEDARKGLDSLNNEFDQADKSSRAVAKAFREAEKEVERLTKSQREQELSLARVGGELTKAGVDVDNLAKEEQRLRDEAAKASKQLDNQVQSLAYAKEAAERNARALDAMGDAFQRLRSQVSDVGDRLLKVGVAAAAAAAALAIYQGAQFFRGGIEDAAEFESALGRIQDAAGLSAEQMSGLKGAIEDTATVASKDVAEAADAFEALTREGLSAAEATAALGPALDFATAALQTGSEAVATLSTALDTFGLGAERTASVADLIAAAALKGGTSIADFAAALEQVGPTASQSGLSIEETSAALAVLAQNGIEGGRAGSAFRQVLDDLEDPASRLRTELDELGISSTDLTGVLQQLGGKGDAAQAVFNALGARGSAALKALAVNGGSALRGLETDLQNVEGAVKSAADTINTDLNTSFDDAVRAFADLRRQLVEPLLEPLRKELDGLSEKLRALAKSPEFAEMRDALSDIFTAGVDAAKEFAAEIDFTAVAGRVSEFARGAADDFQAFAADLRSVVETLATVGKTFGLVIDGVSTGVFAIAAAVSKLVSLGNELNAFHARVLDSVDAFGLWQKVLGVDFPAAADRATERAAGLDAVFEEFADRARQNFDDVREGVDQFGSALPEAAAKAPPAANTIIDELGKVETALDDASAAAADFEASFDQSVKNSQTQVVNLTKSLDDPVAALNRVVADSAKAGRALAEAIKAGAAPEEIARLREEFNKANESIKVYEESLNSAGDAGEETGDQLDRAGGQVEKTGNQVDDASESAGLFSYALRDLGSAAQQTAFSLGAMSDEAARAYQSLNKYASQTRVWAAQMNSLTAVLREQREAAELRIQRLDEELARYDPLAEKINYLRSQYGLLDDATLAAIAQRELALAQEEDRLRREEERVGGKLEQVRQAEARGKADQRPSAFEASGGRSGAAVAGGINVTVNVTGFVGSIDRAAAESIARAIKPQLDRLGALSR